MYVFIKTAILSGVRSRVFYGLLLLSLLVLLLAWLAAYFSGRHPQTLALDVGISGIRLVVILLALYWVQELLAKDIELKTVIFVLSYPVPRACYLLGRFLGIALLAAAAISIMGVIVALLVVFGPMADYPGAVPVRLGLPYIVTLFYLWLAIITIIAFALLIATVSTVPMLPLLLGGAFAVVATSIGPTIDYILLAPTAEPLHQAYITPLLDSVIWLIPDLSRLDMRNWCLYRVAPPPGILLYGLIMPLAYAALMLALAINRFQRREFT